MAKGLTLQEALQELRVTQKVGKKVLEENYELVTDYEIFNLHKAAIKAENGNVIYVDPVELWADAIEKWAETNGYKTRELEDDLNFELSQRHTAILVMVTDEDHYDPDEDHDKYNYNI